MQLAILNELMGLMPNASEHGAAIDHMLEFCHWFMLMLFVGWTTYFFVALFRFHKSRNPKASYYGVKSKASLHVEGSVILVEAVLLLGFALPLWGTRVADFPDKDQALRVRAIGEQFSWTFQYPGPDGVFGKQDLSFVTPANPLGVDPKDPAGKDDFYAKNEMHTVLSRPTVIDITSKDVIHSLALHSMRMDQDATPGIRVPMWFRPIVAGTYEIVCAQLCGAGHYAMRADLIVEKPEEFKEWMDGVLKMQHPELATTAAEPVPAAK